MKREIYEGDLVAIVGDTGSQHGIEEGTYCQVVELEVLFPNEIVLDSTITDGVAFGVIPDSGRWEGQIRWINSSEAVLA